MSVVVHSLLVEVEGGPAGVDTHRDGTSVTIPLVLQSTSWGRSDTSTSTLGSPTTVSMLSPLKYAVISSLVMSANSFSPRWKLCSPLSAWVLWARIMSRLSAHTPAL